MKQKLKTHKGAAKRIKITGKGKLTRDVRRNRNQRFARGTNRKSTNTDVKALILDKSVEKKVKRLIVK